MDPVMSTFLIFLLMGATVLVFRGIVRRPASASQVDAPGLRTMVAFSAGASEFLEDDRPDEPYVGIRLFDMICHGLAAEGVAIDHRGVIQNAQRAECVLGHERFAMVLEAVEDWVISIEWVPESAAEKRHVALTQQVFAPRDSASLRRLLATLDRWLKADARFSRVRWYRKECWIAEDLSDPQDGPID